MNDVSSDENTTENNSTQYWSNLKIIMEKANEIIPSTCRIGKTIFTSMAVIGGQMYQNHPKKLNRIHKDTKDMVSVIITLGKSITGGDTVFYDGNKTNNVGNRIHIIKHSHGRMIFGPFERVSHEGTQWSGFRSVISFILTKQIFRHFYRHNNVFYDRYINSSNLKNYIDCDGEEHVNPKIRNKKRIRNFEHSGYDPIQAMLDRNFKEKKQNFGRKRKSTGCIFLSGSGLRDAVGNYKLRSCLHDAVINAAVRIGKNINKN